MPIALTHPAYGATRPVTAYASVVLCHNPGTMTLDGTNTYVLAAPTSDTVVVVDPGPQRHKSHLDAIDAAVGDREVELILITHRHHDHTGALKKFGRRHRPAPIRAADETFCRGAGPLRDGEIIRAAGLELRVLATPGHTNDSVSFVVSGDDPAVLTGDTILGRGTTVLDRKSGTLADYLSSLRILSDLAQQQTYRLLPAHGPDHADIAPVLAAYTTHRHERLEQIRQALRTLNTSAAAAKPMQVVRTVYADVDKKLWPAARSSVMAQLQYLRDNQ